MPTHPFKPFASRMGYYLGNGEILTMVTDLNLASPIALQPFDGSIIEKADYELAFDLSKGFHFRYSSTSGLTLQPNRPIGIIRISGPETLMLDDLPSAGTGLRRSVSAKVWAVGWKGFGQFTTTSRNGTFTMKATDNEDIGLLPGSPIITQEPASLYALYSEGGEQTPIETSAQFTYMGSRKFQVAILQTLATSAPMIPAEFWEDHVVRLAKSQSSHNELLHLEQQIQREFAAVFNREQARSLARRIRVVAARTRDTSRKHWPKRTPDESFTQFYLEVRKAASQALQACVLALVNP